MLHTGLGTHWGCEGLYKKQREIHSRNWASVSKSCGNTARGRSGQNGRRRDSLQGKSREGLPGCQRPVGNSVWFPRKHTNTPR